MMSQEKTYLLAFIERTSGDSVGDTILAGLTILALYALSRILLPIGLDFFIEELDEFRLRIL